MDRREKVEKALQEGKALPAGPAVMARISDLCKDPHASARDLGKVLQLDSALTTRVLKQVNSSFYGLSATIKTVTHAVVILGFQEIKSVAMSVPVANLYEDNMDAPGIDVAELWTRTLEIACLARALSYHIQYPVPEQVFVSSILTNTGMVILNSILGEEYKAVVESCGEEEFLPEVEKSELGINHVEVCRLLAEKWHFPPDLIEAITRNYDPVQPDGSVLTEAGLIFCARRLRHAIRAGEDPASALSRLPAEVAETFQLTAESVQKSWEKTESDFESARAMLSSD